tara:strand:- start:5152 stop:7629 length:2478 start_codon:yes stop_codon:yes gene_type:complete
MSVYYSSKNIPKKSFGGKADGLIFLEKKGFNVPAFYVIPNATIQQIISEKYTINVLCNEWIENVRPNKNTLWAIRSSAVVEDGKNKSYAGLFSTEINCKPHQLADAFEKVINGFKEVLNNIPEYNKTKNFGFNIVLQEMICGEISGVGFSINPLEQFSENPIINIIPGLGIKLVSGEENAMVINLSSQPEVLSEEKKYYGEVLNSVSGYTKITFSKQELFTKISPYLNKIKKNLKTLEKISGHPVDTEFTIFKNKIYWLQVRPITNLIPKGDYIILDNSNMDANYPDFVTPLTISFVQHSYSNAYLQMCRFLGAKNSFLAENYSLFKNTIKAVNGRMYYNITAYQQLLYQMPFGKKTSALFPKMIGADDASFQKPSQSTSIISYLKLFLNLIWMIIFFENFKKKYVNQNDKVQRNFRNTKLKEKSHNQLIEYFTTIETQLSNYWYVPILNSLFSMIMYNNLTKTLSKSKLHQKYPNFLNDALTGSGKVVSMEIVKELQNLTHLLRENSEVKTIFIEKESDKILTYLKEKHIEYFDAIMSYIQKYGERFDEGELKIETVNYRESPNKFITFLKSNLAVSYERKKVKEKFNYLAVLKETYRNNPIKLLLFKIGIKFTINKVRDRENFRFVRTKTFDMVRQIFREIDEELIKNNTIIASGDSLYLHFEELINPTQFSSQYKEIIKERKEKYATYKELENHIRYHEVNSQLYPILETPTLSKNGLNGVACSSGITEGEILLITAENLHELKIKGKILIAPFFEPGWIGLFSKAEGIISERGSLLSHTSILCREMGIPAIIKAKNCTKNFSNGEFIKMNGATGAIEKIIK